MWQEKDAGKESAGQKWLDRLITTLKANLQEYENAAEKALENAWIHRKHGCDTVFARLSAVGGRKDTFEKIHLVAVREHDYKLFEVLKHLFDPSTLLPPSP